MLEKPLHSEAKEQRSLGPRWSLQKGDKGAAAEPFGCAQGRPAQHVGRLRPAWAPVWGPGPLHSAASREGAASAKLPKRAPIYQEREEGGEEGR
ncbi:Triosephosphate isomerase [Dissostichus eleginoides]|uniref:Triosephosphate isomerase n=1 Tax=Dissostichus eleginoides TaxID=100907 RepID=A0AAD9FLT5_DISEL|nr:Triosephosphate isomerase [Dissostichus eleginoides]